MKIFGTISELVAAVFRKNSQAVTFRPNQTTTYTAARDIQMPQGDTDHVVVSRTSTDTLTNKTLTSPTLTSPSSTDGSFTSVDTFSLDDTASAFDLNLVSTSSTALTANRNLTFDVKNANRTVALGGTLDIGSTFSTTGGAIALTATGATGITLPPTGTLATLTGSETLTNKTISNGTLTGASTTIQDGAAIVDTADATKRLQFDVNGTTGTFTQINTAQTTNRTLTLPDATDTLVGKATTDTLTNKTLTGNIAVNLVSGAATVTLPTTTSTLATLALAETLTNKTLTSPTITSPTVTGGATVRGDLLLQNTAGAQPTLQLSEDPDNGTNKVTIQAPATLGADYTLTLPTTDGNTNEFLQTDGSGNLTWAGAAAAPAEGAVYSNGTTLQTAGAFSGNANEVVGVNSGATAIEYKALATGTSGTDFAITHAAGSVTFNIPSASGSNRGLITPNDQTLGGIKTFIDGIKADEDSGQTTFNYYREDDTSFDSTWITNGAGSAAGSAVPGRITRVGRLVTLEVGEITTGTVAGTSTLVQSVTALPAWATPSANSALFPTWSKNLGAFTNGQTGAVQVLSTGIVRIFRNIESSAYGNSGSQFAGSTGWSITYPV